MPRGRTNNLLRRCTSPLPPLAPFAPSPPCPLAPPLPPSLLIPALERILQTHPKDEPSLPGPVGVNPTLKPNSNKGAVVSKWKPAKPRDYGCAILKKKDCGCAIPKKGCDPDDCTWNAESALASGTCDACPTVHHGDGLTDEEKKNKCEVATVNGGGMPLHNRCKIRSTWWRGWECLQSPALEQLVKAGRAVMKKTEARKKSNLAVFRNPTLTPSSPVAAGLGARPRGAELRALGAQGLAAARAAKNK